MSLSRKGAIPEAVQDYVSFLDDPEHVVTIEPLRVRGRELYLLVEQDARSPSATRRVRFLVLKYEAESGVVRKQTRILHTIERERARETDTGVRRQIYPLVTDKAWVEAIHREITILQEAQEDSDFMTLAEILAAR